MSEIDKIREMVYALARGDMEAANAAKSEVFAAKGSRATQGILEAGEITEGMHNPMRRHENGTKKLHKDLVATESRKDVDDDEEDGVKVKGNRPKPDQSMRRRRPRPSKAYESTEEKVDEKWNTDYETPKSEKGKYKGKTLEQLHALRDKLSDKKDKTKKDTDTLRELNFAIRAKTGWGKVDK